MAIISIDYGLEYPSLMDAFPLLIVTWVVQNKLANLWPASSSLTWALSAIGSASSAFDRITDAAVVDFVVGGATVSFDVRFKNRRWNWRPSFCLTLPWATGASTRSWSPNCCCCWCNSLRSWRIWANRMSRTRTDVTRTTLTANVMPTLSFHFIFWSLGLRLRVAGRILTEFWKNSSKSK